ncbi:hypothetical protein HYW67_01610 [Candidatus Parcubacteria bacterium]|nr:hypothetical protein [Candidatus Parcubacteria bacterium]
MTNPKAELTALNRQLTALGENAEELSYWQDIFEDLTQEEQKQLLAGLREELSALQSL